jgi:pyrroloquinoline-quinone synthase
MNDGELTKEELQRWVANRYMYQVIIPQKDAAILSNCPERDVRRAWISRIYDHDGDDNERGGIESWFVLGEAVGVDREEMASERLVLPAVRYACDAYLNFCRQKPWIEAVASSLTELSVPRRSRCGSSGWKSTTRGSTGRLDYFRARLHLAHATRRRLRPGRRTLPTEQQQKAVAALSFKLDMLWSARRDRPGRHPPQGGAHDRDLHPQRSGTSERIPAALGQGAQPPRPPLPGGRARPERDRSPCAPAYTASGRSGDLRRAQPNVQGADVHETSRTYSSHSPTEE